MEKNRFIPLNRVFVPPEQYQPVHEEIVKPAVRIFKRDRPGKGVDIAIGPRKMFLYVADRFSYILVLNGVPDRRYGEILWQRFAVEGIKCPAFLNRFAIFFQQDLVAFSLLDIKFREVESPALMVKPFEVFP